MHLMKKFSVATPLSSGRIISPPERQSRASPPEWNGQARLNDNGGQARPYRKGAPARRSWRAFGRVFIPLE